MRNFKRLGWAALFLAVVLIGNWLLDCMLYPYTYARVDIHNLETNSYEDIFVGSSHGKSGINPLEVDQVTGRTSTNLCLGGEYPIDVYYLVKEAFRVGNPSRIIYEVDPGYWMGEIGENVSFGQSFYEMPWSSVKLEYFREKFLKRDFRNSLFRWYLFRNEYANISYNFNMKFSKTYQDYGITPFDKEGQRYCPEGFIYRDPIPNENKIEENLVLWDETLLNEDAKRYFEKLKALCEEHQAELVVITTPSPQVTLDKYPKEYRQAYDFFADYMKQQQVEYINFNELEDSEVDQSLDAFGDYDGHMDGEPANKFSKVLGRYLCM